MGKPGIVEYFPTRLAQLLAVDHDPGLQQILCSQRNPVEISYLLSRRCGRSDLTMRQRVLNGRPRRL
jgi:hypothetical protein